METISEAEVRTKLKPYHGKRITVTATFDQIIKKPKGEDVLTICCVQDVEKDGELLCDHAYIQHAETIQALDFQKYETIQLSVMVNRYFHQKLQAYNYGFIRPTEVKSLRPVCLKPAKGKANDMNQT